jgi:hypothetical protein
VDLARLGHFLHGLLSSGWPRGAFRWINNDLGLTVSRSIRISPQRSSHTEDEADGTQEPSEVCRLVG